MVFGLWQAAILSHSAYRALLPNGYNVFGWAGLGHADPRGGGTLNPFGEAFKNSRFKWTRALCEADSDGDGESNGLELGDPCCSWSEAGSSASKGEAQFESHQLRSWRVSHPGLAHPWTEEEAEGRPMPLHASGVPMPNCSRSVELSTSSAEFQRFYFSSVEDAPVVKAPVVEDLGTSRKEVFNLAHLGTSGTIALYSVLACFVVACIRERRQEQGFSPPLVSSGRKLQTNLGVAAMVLVLLAAALYTDGLSGALHIVLDIPAVTHLPFIGGAARGFQDHHLHPEGITRLEWTDFLSKHKMPMVLVALPGLIPARCFPRWSRLHSFVYRIFLAEVAVLSDLMMASHRWAHTAPHKLSSTVQTLQQWGVCVSAEYHSQHHVSFDRNFAIFSGLAEPVISFVRMLVPHYSMGWLGILALYSVVVPLLFTYVFMEIWLRLLDRLDGQRVSGDDADDSIPHCKAALPDTLRHPVSSRS